MKQVDTSKFWLLKTLLHMKIEFQNSIVRLSFLYRIANIKIAWINLCSSHCPHTKQFHRAHNRIMLGSKFAKKGHYIKCFLEIKYFRKSIFVIWWIAKQSVIFNIKKSFKQSANIYKHKYFRFKIKCPLKSECALYKPKLSYV